MLILYFWLPAFGALSIFIDLAPNSGGKPIFKKFGAQFYIFGPMKHMGLSIFTREIVNINKILLK